MIPICQPLKLTLDLGQWTDVLRLTLGQRLRGVVPSRTDWQYVGRPPDTDGAARSPT